MFSQSCGPAARLDADDRAGGAVRRCVIAELSLNSDNQGRWVCDESLASVLALALAGCAGAWRAPAPIGHPAAMVEGFERIRIRDSDPELIGVLQHNLAQTRAASDQPISVLALSGGGAEGAFGAGVMAGWTESGTRPEFQVVTGVSAGALIAPFAFLGPAWDAKLREAFAGRLASGLLIPRGLGSVTGASIYSGRPLERLVGRYIDEDLLAAVAREHAKGRLAAGGHRIPTPRASHLVVWDMGAIAAQGGPAARGRCSPRCWWPRPVFRACSRPA